MSGIISSPKKDYAGRRLSSLMKDLQEAESGHDRKTFGFGHRLQKIAEKYEQVLDEISESFPDITNLPEKKDLTQIQYESGDSGLAQYLKSEIRNIADILDIQIIDGKENPTSSPSVIVDARTTVSQINVQNMENMVKNINDLKINPTDKQVIIELLQEFDKEAKGTKDGKKLRDLFFKIASLSIDAGTLLLQHANGLGILASLFLH